MFLCTTVNSPLTTTIVGSKIFIVYVWLIIGHAKSAISILLSLFVMPARLTILNGAGLMLNMFGGVWYSYIKFKEQKEKEQDFEKKEIV